MGDPQDGLRIWLVEKLIERGAGSCGDLARMLGVPLETVTRMKNRDGCKRSRRIEAHHIPILAAFFGEWPPGYEPMNVNDKRLAMVIEAVERRLSNFSSPAAKAECIAQLYRLATLVDTGVAAGQE